MSKSQVESEIDRILTAVVETILQRSAERSPSLASAIFSCAVPRWFNNEVIMAMCPSDEVSAILPEEIFQQVLELPFCEPYPKRSMSWMFNPAYRAYLLRRKEVIEHWQELNRRAAAIFKQMLDAKALKGAERFQDPDWREIATEWVYHLLNLDPVTGLKVVWKICAEAFAVPTFGNRWEVNFCLEFLNGLEWPLGLQEVDESIKFLKTGFGYLAAYQDTKSLDMVRQLANVTDITPQEKAELYSWIGTVHLDQEYRYTPALEEFEKALEELDRAKQDNPDEARLKEIRIKEANIYAFITDVYLPDPSSARYDLALEYAERAKKLAPDQAVGYVTLGKIYAQQEDWNRAEELYQKAKEVEPYATDAYLGLSEVFEARRDLDSVDKILDEVTKIDHYYVLIRKGNAYFSARQFEDAEKLYQQAKKEAADRIDAYLALGNLYSTLGSMYENVGQSAKAEKFYQNAIDIAPDLDDGYVALANMYEQREKWERTIEIYQEALDKEVRNKKSLYVIRSRVYIKQGRFEDLRKIQEKIVCDDPMEKYAAHCVEGNAYLTEAWNLRNKPEQAQFVTDAKCQFEKALETDDKRAWAYLSLAQLAVLREDEAKIQQLRQLVGEKVSWAQYDLLVCLGQTYQDNFQGEKSEAVLKQATKVAPHRITAWRTLSDLYIWQGNLAGVEQVWSELVSIDKTLKYEGHITVGNAYQKVANFTKAREEYTKARDLEPQTADAYLYLAMLDKDEDSWNDAVTNYLKAAEIASDFASFVYAQIAEIYLDQEYYEDAAELAKRAILFDAEQLDGYLALAYLGISQDNDKRVQKVRKRLKSIAPDQLCDFDCALGDYCLKIQKYEKAKQVYCDCIKCSSKKADAYVHLGLALMEQEQYGEASKQLKKALQTDSTNAEAYAALGQLYLAQGDLQRGIDEWDKAVKLEPTGKYDACLAIGAAYEIKLYIPAKQSGFKTIIQKLIRTLLKGNSRTNQYFHLATQQYRKAINLYPWRLEAYINLATLFVEQHKLEAADKIYRQAKESTGYSYLDWGWYYVQQEKLDEAFRVYHLGIKEEPAQLDPYVGLMHLLVIEKRKKQAFKLCNKISPELRYDAYLSLGDILSNKQIFKVAEAAYWKAVDFNPNRPEAYIRVAQLFANRDFLDEALKICDQMAQRPEPDLKYIANISQGNLLVDKGNAYISRSNLLVSENRNNEAELAFQGAEQEFQKAERSYQQAIQLYHRVAELQADKDQKEVDLTPYLYIGDRRIQQKRYPQAVEALQQAVQLQPDNQDIKISLAEAYLSWGKDDEQRGNFNQALAKYTHATEEYSKYTDAYIARAKLYGLQGDMDSLERMAQQILELDPADEYDASFVVANAYKAVGNSEKEEKIYRQLIDKYPKQPKAWMWLAQLLAEQQHLEESIQCYQTATKLLFEDTEVSDAYKNIGNLYSQQERYSEALEAFQKAVEHNPLNAEAYFSIGAISEYLNNLNQAVEMYTKTIEKDPKYTDAYLALGRIFKQKGKDEELEKLIQKILALDSEDKYEDYLVSAAIYQETGKNEQAEKTYQQAIKEYPKQPDAYTSLIQLLVDRGELEQAIKVCEEMSKQPDLAYNATIMRGNVLQVQEKYNEAEQAYQSTIEQDAKRTEVYLQLAYLHQQRNELAKAEQSLKQGLAAIPNNPDLYWMLAELYKQQQQWDKAISSYQNAAEHQPDPIAASTAYEWIGELLIQQGDFHEAIKALQRARVFNLYNAGAHFRLGIAYENLDRLDEAVKMYTRAIQIDPQYFSAYTSLCRIYGKKGDVPGIDRMAHQIKTQSKKLQLDKTVESQAHLIIAHAYVEVQLYEWAIKEFADAVKIDPNLPDAHTGLGYIYEIKQQWAKARAEYEKFAQLLPQWRSYVELRIGQLFILENNLEEAEKAFHEAISLAPEKLDIAPSANLFLADIYRKQGRNQEMLKACANVVSLVSRTESPDFNAIRQQGLAHFIAGEYEEAAQSLNRALEANPQDPQARFYFALNLLCQGQSDQAQEELQQGINLAPYKSYYKYAIEEAKVLAARTPEVPGAKEMLQALIEARDNAK